MPTMTETLWSDLVLDLWQGTRWVLKSQIDIERWEEEIGKELGRRPPTRGEVAAALRWGIMRSPWSDMEAVSWRDIVSMVNHFRAEQAKSVPDRGGLIPVTDEQARQIRDAVHDWIMRMTGGEPGVEYRLIKPGELLEATDEYWDGRGWVALGAGALDGGKRRPMVGYRNTRVRRKKEKSTLPGGKP